MNPFLELACALFPFQKEEKKENEKETKLCSRELACRFNDRKPLDPASRHGNLDNLTFSRRSLNLPQISSVVCKPADNAADSLNSVQFSRETGARSILPFHLPRSFLPFHPKGTETETVCSKEGFLIRINVFSKSSFITLC